MESTLKGKKMLPLEVFKDPFSGDIWSAERKQAANSHKNRLFYKRKIVKNLPERSSLLQSPSSPVTDRLNAKQKPFSCFAFVTRA